MATTLLPGYPDATTTGVQSGVALTVHNGDLIVNTPGAVISGLDVRGSIIINAPNVTIENCKVTFNNYWGVQVKSGVTGTVVQNCEINGSGTSPQGVNGILGQGTFLNNNIYNVENGIAVDGNNTVIKGNYIHDFYASGSPHYDGVQISGALSNILVSHNTIVNQQDQNAAVYITNDWGTISNVIVDDNQLIGAGYVVYSDEKGGGSGPQITGVQFTNNKLGVGHWGYAFVSNNTVVWQGNTEISNGKTVSVDGKLSDAPPPATSLDAPIITAWSNDTGVANDKITNDNTLTLKGTAAANSTIKLYDGSTQIGSTTADASGAWSYTTAALSDTRHVLTATATNSSGKTSAASTALTVAVDTAAPNAPVLTANSVVSTNKVLLSGTAEANSTITIYDGTKAIGTATTNASGSWSVTTSALSTGTHSLSVTATDVAGNVGAKSKAVDAVISGTPTPPAQGPAAPSIASFSQDSGVVGDKITNDNTLTLTGTAVANSTVKVFDGTTQVGTATANGSGQWTLTTSTLKDGSHSLTATATNASGQTSAASTVLAVTIDTKAPVVPTLGVSSQATASLASTANVDKFILQGTAEANSTVKVFDGAKQIGTATANSSGAWSFDPGNLTQGSHSFTATATDVAGNASTASVAKSVNVSGSGPATPVIASFSKDSGVVGDKITNDNTLTLTGTAVANGTVKVFDGATQVGTVKANSSGQWTLTTPTLKDGGHSLTATVTDASGKTSAASTTLSLTIDTKAPVAPTLGIYSQTGASIANTANLDKFILKGTAEANSTVKVFDGAKQIGTATTNGSGAWSFDTGQLNKGAHSFTATATDAAGNASAASVAKGVNVAGLSTIEFTSLSEKWIYTTIKGTADPNSQIKLYDGKAAIGQVTADSNGAWTFQTKGLSDTIHTFTAQGVDGAGKVVATSAGQAILGSSKGNTLTGTSGDDYFFGNGHPDTFVFAPNFGNDVIKDFVATGRTHDTIKFSSSVFDSFASVLSHASQVGQDVVIASGQDTLTLKNVKLSSLNSHDFQFA